MPIFLYCLVSRKIFWVIFCLIFQHPNQTVTPCSCHFVVIFSEGYIWQWLRSTSISNRVSTSDEYANEPQILWFVSRAKIILSFLVIRIWFFIKTCNFLIYLYVQTRFFRWMPFPYDIPQILAKNYVLSSYNPGFLSTCVPIHYFTTIVFIYIALSPKKGCALIDRYVSFSPLQIFFYKNEVREGLEVDHTKYKL